MSDMRSAWEEIDAATAARYLENAETLRPITPSTVEVYKRDMVSGYWFPTHQGIAFKTVDGTEVLYDGGHRMRAILLADKESPGIKIRIWVTRDAEPTAFEGIDIGRNRSNANLVQAWYPDMVNYKDVSAIARRGLSYTAGHPWVKYQTSKHELHQFIEDHPSIQEAARLTHNWRMPRATLAPTAAGFLCWVLMKIDNDDAIEFMTQLRRGSGLEDMDPILVLRNRLLGGDTRQVNYLAYSQKTRGREPEIAIALSVQAWNKWRAHEAISKLQLPHRSLSDENFPVPRELISWKDPRGLLKG